CHHKCTSPLLIFPTLRNKARAWTRIIPRNVTFLNKYYPSSKTDEIKRKITNFPQEDNESFPKTYGRFLALLLAFLIMDFIGG
ncbi:hypothetical protein CR513_59582, partial [Mucuna pruriens]